MRRLRIAATRDLRTADGEVAFGAKAFARLASEMDLRFLRDDVSRLSPGQLADYDVLLHFSGNLIGGVQLSAARRLGLIARLGVGVDQIDLDACTDAGVLVSITPEAVRRPMATGAVAMILALTMELPAKDRLVRQGDWAGRLDTGSSGLDGRTIGIIGYGNIGREIACLTAPFGARRVAYGPRLPVGSELGDGVVAADLEALLRVSDVVCVCCPLTSSTRGMISWSQLALMKPTAVLVNIARGPIVEERALVAALQAGRLAGAALDVFDQEPLPRDHPLVMLPQVVLSPHTVGYTASMRAAVMAEACSAVLAFATGRVPAALANPTVLRHPRVRRTLGPAVQIGQT